MEQTLPRIYTIVRSDDVGVYGVEIVETDEQLQKEMDFLGKKGASLKLRNVYSDGYFEQYTYEIISNPDEEDPMKLYVTFYTVTICQKTLFRHLKEQEIELSDDILF